VKTENRLVYEKVSAIFDISSRFFGSKNRTSGITNIHILHFVTVFKILAVYSSTVVKTLKY